MFVFKQGKALRYTAAYLLIATAWIVLSDRLVETMFADTHELSVAQSIKGWMFVVINAVALYALLRCFLSARWRVKNAQNANRIATEALRDSEFRFRQVVENIQEVFYLTDPANNEMLYISPAYERIWGRSSDSLYLQPGSWLAAVHPDDRTRIQPALQKLKATGVLDEEYRVVRPDGSMRWINARTFPIVNDAGDIYRVAGVATDITDRVVAEQKVRRLNRVYAVLSGINSAIVHIHDRQQLLQEACRIAVTEGAFRMAWVGEIDPATQEGRIVASFGASPAYLAGIKFTSTDNIEDQGPASRAMREKTHVLCSEISDRTAPGLALQEQGVNACAAFPLMAGNRVIGVLSLFAAEASFFDDEELKLLNELAGDIAFGLEHISNEERLHYLACNDALTGLPNDLLFHDRLTQFVSSARRSKATVSVMLVDLDRFTQLNDMLGRHAGDSILRTTAARLKSVLREPYSLARISADTFAIAVPDISRGIDTASIIYQRLLSAFSEPVTVDGKELQLSAKVGIAFFPSDGQDADTLFKNAEAALRRAQISGDACLYYAPEMNAEVSEKITIESRLRKALERREFVLHYQPKIDAKSRRISGVEALIRWNDPVAGLVAPSRFIPVLEETGLIVEVGQWALRQALSDYGQWQASGLQPPRVAVNVSAVQLRQSNFAEKVHAAVQDCGTGPESLELEITESLIMEDIDVTGDTLRKINDMGITLAIDDFGTGYSSLHYLAKLPVDTLKIDRSFIITMAADQDSMAIVSTIISLAHTLGMTVVAEGVDADEQAKYLKMMKCDEMQGYLFSRPVPAEDFAELLRKQAGADLPRALGG